MSSQLTDRRRAIGNRASSSSNTNVTTLNRSSNTNGSTVAISNSGKYHPGKRINIAVLIKRGLLLVALASGIAFYQYQSSPSSLIRGKFHSKSNGPSNRDSTVGNCKLRNYPKRRYYGMHDRPLPDFLDTEYIYGELPTLLQPSSSANQATTTKLCVDQSEWYHPDVSSPPMLPFADGTNPSILRLVDNPRIDPSIRELFSSTNGKGNDSTPYYLATICMTNSQCSWKDTPEEIARFALSRDEEPATVRTVLLVLNQNFETLEEVTIQTRIDVHYGGRRNRRPVKAHNQLQSFALDDARLFTYKGQIWVSYREGKLFGYETQVLNKIHFERGVNTSNNTTTTTTKALRTIDQQHEEQQLTATLLASEVETLCCGRNMALIDNVHTDRLQALTWVDPVTVVDVDTHKTDGTKAKSESKDDPQEQHSRNLAQKKKKENKKKSHIHGTNGFMVHLPKTGEYLGIGHFHRPHGREQNDYARFGHHYTHTFFTISDTPPVRLERLSPEFILPSHTYPKDGDIIQFWSGLELVPSSPSTGSDSLVLGYGINDCEGAAMYLDLAMVEGLLREVPEGKEVVDFMTSWKI